MKKRYTFQWLLGFAIASIIGILLASQLSIQLSPNRVQGNLTIQYTWASASPELIEQQITSRLEGAFSTLQGVQKVTSVSGYHHGSITLELDKGVAFDNVRFEVSTLIRQLYPSFPQGVSYPTVTLNSPLNQEKEKPLLTLQLNGLATASVLQRYAEEQLAPRLAQVGGVYSVQAYGGNKMEYVVRYDLEQAQALGIQEQDITKAIEAGSTAKSLGVAKLQGGEEVRVVTLPAMEKNFNTPIERGGSGSEVIQLKDIATISREEQSATNYYRINGQNAINLVVTAETGANQLAVVEELKKALVRIRQLLPATYALSIEYDATAYIKENLHQIAIQSGLAVLILLVFVGVTSRSWRYTLLISVSIVVNLLLAAILFYVFRVEIHLYSLAALTTSLGIIIDNVIVMIDHYRRYRNLRVFTALLGATLTTCAGLIVLWFLPDEIRYDLWDFALVLVITLGISLVVALWFIPAAMEQWQLNTPTIMQQTIAQRRHIVKIGRVYEKLLRVLLRFRKTAFAIALLAFGLPVFMLPTHIEEDKLGATYYNTVFGSDAFIDNVKPAVDKWLGGTLRLFVNYVYEGAVFSTPERTALYVVANLPNQSTIEQMDAIFRRVEQYVGQFREVDRFITHIYNGQQGSMVIYFKPDAEQGSFPYILKNRAITLSTEMSGISWDIYGVGQGFSQNLGENETPTFTVAMRGYNYTELEKQANLLKSKLEKHPRIQQVNINRSPDMFGQKFLYEYVFDTDSRRMRLHNIDIASIYTKLAQQNARPQADLHSFVAGEYTPIKIIPVQAMKFDQWQLYQQPFWQDSTMYRLRDLGRMQRQRVTPEIHKENQEYIRLVSFEYFGSAHFGEKFLTKTLEEFNPSLPLGYIAKKQDYNWWSQEARKQYELIGLVIVLIYIICAIIFESLRQPFALIMLIPLSFIGVFLAFYWFDFNFDQGGYASFILLSGNVVCAGIFLIAEFNTVRRNYPKKSLLRCYLQAYQHKIIPILLTVLSTVLGLVPFLIYGQNETFWFALGVGTIGGLLMSLLVIWLYLPLFLLNTSSRKLEK